MSRPRTPPGLRRTLTGAVLAPIALCACGSSDAEPPQRPPCPATVLLEGAERTTAYREPTSTRPADLRYVAVLTELTSSCRFDEDGAGLEIDLGFNLIAERGPAFADDTPEQVAYFIATVGPGEEIVAKDRLETDLVFGEGQGVAGWAENLTLRVPNATADTSGTYALFVGFQLDDAELARRNRPLFR